MKYKEVIQEFKDEFRACLKTHNPWKCRKIVMFNFLKRYQFIIGLGLGLLLMNLFGCMYLGTLYKNYPSDNILEEKVEEIIKMNTGVDVDLSPLSPESSTIND